MREVRHPKLEIRQNAVDKIVSYLSPVRGVRRMHSRAIMALAESYKGASKRRRSLSEWDVSAGDSDTDLLPYLASLRERSRDLERNNAIAAGAINTKTTSIVGTGLQFKAVLDRNILNMAEEEADAWERKTEAEFKLFCKYCDVEDTLNFIPQIQELALRSTLINGDVFVLTPMIKDHRTPYATKLQLIEADRICNENNAVDTDTLSGGIERNENGAPVRVHILEGHPGNVNQYAKNNKWRKVDVYGKKTGRRNILHLYHKIRIGQSRGVPDLAPVIEEIKQLGRYTEAEVSAAVVSAFFTVFIKSESGQGLAPMQPTSETGETGTSTTTDKDFKLGPAAMLDLRPGEDIITANPGRPNEKFEPFVFAILSQVGTALGLPFEVLVKRFNSSYSASKAALLEAWRFFMSRRKWLVDVLCMPVYELFLTEAVALGRISAPGFLNGDPAVRMAYLGARWTGPAKILINEKVEIDAAKERVDMGVSTLEEETAALTGGDWEQKHPQRAKEARMRRKDGLEAGISMKENNGGQNND